jgi:hypothetical protein
MEHAAMRIRSINRALARSAVFALAIVGVARADMWAQAQGGNAGAAQGRGAAPAPGRGGGNAGGAQGRGGQGRGAAAPALPTPRRPDGKPILGSVPGQPVGGWGAGVTTLPQGQLNDIPFQPWARAVYDVRQIDQFEPHTRCKASGVARQFSTPYGTEFVEVPDLQRMYIMDNGGPNSYRVIYLDGRSFPADLKPTNYGYSIGHWEGDTLVIETRGLNEKFWMDTRGTPHTAQLKFTERLTRTDMNTMQYQATIDDPGAYTRPWTTTQFNLRWRPGEELFEYICQQFNQGPELMIGSQEEVDNTRFFVP